MPWVVVKTSGVAMVLVFEPELSRKIVWVSHNRKFREP